MEPDTNTAERDVLLNAIADYWGGVGCRRNWGTDNTFNFASEDGMVYKVSMPGTATQMYEDSGRPAGKVVFEEYLVRCLTDAPDAAFTVDSHGVYHGYNGTVNLLD